MADPDIPVVYDDSMPMNEPYKPHQPPHTQFTAVEIRALKDQGFTSGLAQALAKNNAVHARRFWVVDNSGSMIADDGSRMLQGVKNSSSSSSSSDEVKMVSCSRWSELQETCSYHAQLATLIQAPSVFRLLNPPSPLAGPQRFSVAEQSGAVAEQDLMTAIQTIWNTKPGGCTPLAQHVREIQTELRTMERYLKSNGTKVALVLATDGLPSDERGISGHEQEKDFISALRSLEGLPVWVVVRLCTNDPDIVQFYNALDAQLEISLDVLDDFVSEASEIHKVNGWLNYALPLHRMREMGFYNRMFDLLDERRLTKDELREFMLFLFGDTHLADPQVDWAGFVRAIEKLQHDEKKAWNPITKKVAPWIDIGELNRTYNSG